MIPFPESENRNTTLRPVNTREDLSFLLQVYASTRMDILSYEAWTNAEKEAFITQQFMVQHKAYAANYPGGEFHVIENGNRNIGRLYFDVWDSEVRIVDIAILPEYRNRGIGSALLDDILLWAHQNGKKVSIHVEKENPALSLYLRKGFSKQQEIPFYDLMETRVQCHERNTP